MADIVHVSFAGGGIFLPNEGPADRQYLVDYVTHLLHSKPQVQILRANQRWMAEPCGHYCCCAGCGRASKAVCRESSRAKDAYCLRCALETEEAARSRKRPRSSAMRQLKLSPAGA